MAWSLVMTLPSLVIWYPVVTNIQHLTSFDHSVPQIDSSQKKFA